MANSSHNSLISEATLFDRKLTIYWPIVLFFVYIHGACLYLIFVQELTLRLFAILFLIGYMSLFGVTIGAHRYFTHRSFKANAKLKVLLIFLQTLSMQNSIYTWVRDHRMHHKHMDTNADPHNSKRGFFFSHMGWLMCRKHPEFKQSVSKIFMADLIADSAIMLQHKYYLLWVIIFGMALPTIVLNVIANSWAVAWNANILRYVLQLHATWTINSISHMWGDKPYDRYRCFH